MRFIMHGKSKDILAELVFLVQIEEKLNLILVRFRAEPWDNMQN